MSEPLTTIRFCVEWSQYPKWKWERFEVRFISHTSAVDFKNEFITNCIGEVKTRIVEVTITERVL